jgi:hypothetical protein
MRVVLLPFAVLLALAACSNDTASSSRLRSGAPSSSSSSGGGAPGVNGDTPASRDAGASSPGVDPGPNEDDGSCAGRAICDSFEDRAPGDPPGGVWKVETSGSATVRVSDTRAYGGGTRSVKITTPAAGYQHGMFVASGAPLFGAPSTAGTTLYGRMMVWLENPAANGVHWTMLAGEGPIAGQSGVRGMNRYGGQHMGKLSANFESSGKKSDCWQHSQTVMPIGRWACFAWKLEGPKNEMQIALDGDDIADLKVGEKGQGCIGHDFQDIWTPPTFERAVIGWESYQQDAAHTMYVDDVVLDDKPIACP